MTYKKKLIEVALPLERINQEAAREKSIRHGHPSTLHLWWARRPLAAARAVLWASLIDDPSSHPDRFPTEEEQTVERKRLFGVLERLLPWDAPRDGVALTEALNEITKSCGDHAPTILDPFGGGATIPLEALRLGLTTYSGDLNPVAVLVQRAMLEIPGRFSGRPPVHPEARTSQTLWDGVRGLAADVDAYGRWMREEAKNRLAHLYPLVEGPDGSSDTPIAWIWARTVKSPDPSWPGHVPLVRSWVLAKRPGKPTVWVEPQVDQAARTISYKIRTGGSPPDASVSRGSGVCMATGTTIPPDYIKLEAKAGRMSQVLLAIVVDSPRGRTYVGPTTEHLQPANVPVPADVPSARVPVDPRNIWVTLYGLDEWWKLFTPRQLVALTTFSDLLETVHARVVEDASRVGLASAPVRLRDGGDGPVAYADAVVTYLAFVIDKCADYWSTLSAWVPSGEFANNTFGRQAIPMSWDFAEVNPLSGLGGSWDAMLAWEKRVLDSAVLVPDHEAHVAQRDASALIEEVGRCVLATDPPYYDNISYADLSDFFFVWLRRGLKDVWPSECATLVTPKADELIANPYRTGSKSAAQAFFEQRMADVMATAAVNADPAFPATIFYAFKATESKVDGVVSTGWETFLSGLLGAGYAITATWPLRTERAGGLKVGRSMLASSIVLACRPRAITAPLATRGDFIAALRNEMRGAIHLLQLENIAPVDLAQSAMGPGIAIFSRYAKVVEADGRPMTVRTALAVINDVLAEVLSGEESEFDADTRFALTWFEQFGSKPGPFGDADLLARAKDTTVSGVAEAGIVSRRDGKVRLIKRDELPQDWDPASDRRLTVWETTQHLIRALESSESEAALLLGRLGTGLGDRARQLAYLLYGVCDRKKWAEEAGAYNMFVTAWPEISRLASATGTESAEATLF